jgi:hypothetical protein
MENVFVITLDREQFWFGARPLTYDRWEAPGGTGNRTGHISQETNAHEHAHGQQDSEEKAAWHAPSLSR